MTHHDEIMRAMSAEKAALLSRIIEAVDLMSLAEVRALTVRATMTARLLPACPVLDVAALDRARFQRTEREARARGWIAD
ncbi:MAG: hypothetical protein AAFR46_02775 [Pseudomonadota bacterium]